VFEGFGNAAGHLKAERPNRLWSQTLNIPLFFPGAGASSTMDRWHRYFEQAMEAQRAEEDEDFEEFEEFFFDKLVTSAQEGDSPSTLRWRFFGSLLEYSTPSLCTFV
jgi:hypothetical protein